MSGQSFSFFADHTVDRDDSVQTIAEMINKENGNGQKIAEPFFGYTADEVFPEADLRPDSRPSTGLDHLRPRPGITRDQLGVKIDKRLGVLSSTRGTSSGSWSR